MGKCRALGCRTIVVITAVLAALVFTGCATKTVVYDPSVPTERLCTLKIDVELSVQQFDSDTVDWNYGGNPFISSYVVVIPAGYHQFVMSWMLHSSMRYSYARNIMYSYTFEAGKTYIVAPKVQKDRVSIEVTEEKQ